MRLGLAKAHYPVTVLGPGRRIGLWVQGCTIACPGCISADTWPADDSRAVEIGEVLAWCRTVARDGVDGVTVTGGEPFEQPEALEALLEGLHVWRRERSETGAGSMDLLCYSGLPWRALRRRFPQVLDLLDAVIPEPYVDGMPVAGAWRGSANQPIVALTDLGRERYPSGVDEGLPLRLQLDADGDTLWAIGIPRRGDLEAFERLAAERGLRFGEPSWRP